MKKITGVLLIVVMLMMIAIPADAGRYRGGGGGGEFVLGAVAFWVVGGIVHHIIDATTEPKVVYVIQPQQEYRPSCRTVYDCAYQRKMIELQRQDENKALAEQNRLRREYDSMEREKGQNDALRDYRDYRY